jgi:hypothetical protein
MSLKNYSVMPAPVLGVRIRIVVLRIQLLASTGSRLCGSSAQPYYTYTQLFNELILINVHKCQQ